MVWPARDKAALFVCARDQQLGPAATQREGEEPTSAAVPAHWIQKDGRLHMWRGEETDRGSSTGKNGTKTGEGIK